MAARRALFDNSTWAFLITLVALTALRIYALQISPLDLNQDEAQYWAWSQTLQLGYFSKPPLIAWAIRATTQLFGDAEWAVRLAAPVCQAVAALALWALGRAMYGAWSGFWAGLTWLLLPGIWLSSAIISTDALLLPLWATGLYALWQMTQSRSWGWAVLLGIAVGIGLEAKYAMFYFPLCVAVAAWWSKPVRQALGNGRGLVAALIAILLIAPNLYWNATNGFATAEHTAANARIDATKLFRVDEVFDFLASQLAVVGPLLFLALLALLWRAFRRAGGLNDEDRFLLAFSVPMLLLMTGLAFISRANGNWAATAYPAAIVWITGNLMVSVGGRRFLAAAAVVNVAIAGVAALAAFNSDIATQIKNVRNSVGWEETAQEIAVRAMPEPGQPPYTAVLVDDRELYFELAYYWRHARRANAPLPPVRMWLLRGSAHNSAEAADPMRPEEGARVLVVHATPGYIPFLSGDFTAFRNVEHLQVPLGAGRTRDLELSIGEGFAPAPRDAEFETRLREAGARR
ncbi:ArnT family glycosyltransferase [Terricaulis sp.]|uniref:ArnT family glycosyltransferase n=1 Tax=Terricaulis sp. TaxID=2768686 RepID=UPI003782EB5C